LQWRYGVKAVNNNAGCTDPSRWKESDFSNFVLDACQ